MTGSRPAKGKKKELAGTGQADSITLELVASQRTPAGSLVCGPLVTGSSPRPQTTPAASGAAAALLSSHGALPLPPLVVGLSPGPPGWWLAAATQWKEQGVRYQTSQKCTEPPCLLQKCSLRGWSLMQSRWHDPARAPRERYGLRLKPHKLKHESRHIMNALKIPARLVSMTSCAEQQHSKNRNQPKGNAHLLACCLQLALHFPQFGCLGFCEVQRNAMSA